MTYRPEPLDLSRIELGPELALLLERLAENTHETWAALRIKEGWVYGTKRDDAAKTHPGLVPYHELPESEKTYDRETAAGALKAILLFGYSITPPQHEASPFVRTNSAPLLETLKNLKSKLGLLRSMWEQRDLKAWSQTPEAYDLLAEVLCAKGEPFWAYDVAAEGIRLFPGRLRLLQLQAWALAQTGSTRAAEQLLTSLRGAGHADPETLGLLGRAYKDLAAASSGGNRASFLRLARNAYLEGFKLKPNSYNGINAATTTLLLSSTKQEWEEAAQLSDRAAEACRCEAELTGSSLWTEATLGEAELVKGQMDLAARHYSTFSTLAAGNTGAIQSARAQARRILAKRQLDTEVINEWMPVSPIMMFAGHMVDAPNRTSPRLPPEMCEPLKAQIRARLDHLDARIGFSSAACGSDILFLEAMLERGGEIHVVLPCSVEGFREVSVRQVGGDAWAERFDAILPHVSTLHVASHETMLEGTVLFEFGSRFLLGLSRMKARILDAPLHPLAVWDGCETPHGTASDIRLWKEIGLHPEIISLPLSWTTEVPVPPQSSQPNQEIKAMLFADVVGYSKLPERDIPAYSDAFLGGIAQLLETLPEPPLTRNTWGDAVYFVFATARGAGDCALRLREFVQTTDWLQRGLSRPLNIRIGLHAGPVFPLRDAVTGFDSFCGVNVSRAARIEPISAEGQAYASEAFAALAESEFPRSFACHYIGEKSLPKKAGTIRIYQIDRTTT